MRTEETLLKPGSLANWWATFGLLGLASGCAAEDSEPTDTQDGACGDPSLHEVEVQGLVVEAGTTSGYDGVTVTLFDGQWDPPTSLGVATTGADGRFVLDATGVTDLPGCWGIVLDYTLVAALGSDQVERGVNGPLEAAVRTGQPAVVDVPIELPVP